ncbi:MAG: N-acetylmuramoyl-L-alanine amidase [Lachnospiraceae bacterium]|nr:N-acetylmuramoyl-L-alanine amidase [Lachnospiraceae bacterium]
MKIQTAGIAAILAAMLLACTGCVNRPSASAPETPAPSVETKAPSSSETQTESEAPTETPAESPSETEVPTEGADPSGERPRSEILDALRSNYARLVVVTNTTTLNVRRRPTTDAPVIGFINELGGADDLGDCEEAGWLHVRSGMLEGYVSAGFVTQGDAAYEKAADAAEERVRVILDKVNLRSGPSTDSDILDVVTKGAVYEVLSETDGFFEVPFLARTAYISGTCVEKSWFLKEATKVDAPPEESAAPESTAPPTEEVPSQTPERPASNGHIVCIDAGHQAHGIPEKEPNGPGSDVMKAKLTTGTSGCVTRVAEHVVNLQVALKLRDVLESRGYTVVMIRTTEDCPLSNAERAVVSNESGAEIFLRLHCNGVDDQNTTGIINYAPKEGNPYMDADVVKKSIDLARIQAEAICAVTGAKNLGVLKDNTMTGINWSKIPVAIIEMGFMSNPDEDRKLVSDDYQKKLAEGMANGVDVYFSTH